MAYSADAFVFLLPVVVALFFAFRSRRGQHLVLGAVSLAFLGWTGLINVVVALAMIGVALSYLRLHPQQRRSALPWVLGLLLANLAFFKYRDFLSDVFGVDGPALPGLAWAVPLGISFYTFQLIASLLDAPDVETPDTSIKPPRFALFVLFFPHLVAGPICRLRQLYPQFEHAKRFSARFLASGAQLFTLGYCKKVLIADPIARAIDPLWADASGLSAAAAWLAVVGFYLQVYADFSGYTDMGRGIARTMRFRLPINFRAPYLAASPVDFWSRWHITLSNFAKAHIYNPIAIAIARRTGRARKGGMLFALVATMVLLGLWHGAAWRFVLFGLLQGLLLAAWHGSGAARFEDRRGFWVAGVIATQGLLILSFVVFRAESLTLQGHMFDALFSGGQRPAPAGLAMLILSGALAVFAIQVVDLFATRRAVARWLTLPRRYPWIGVAIALIFIVAFAAKRRLVEAGAPRFERFIYFDF